MLQSLCLRPIFFQYADKGLRNSGGVWTECRNGKGRRKRHAGAPIVAHAKGRSSQDIVRWRASAVLTELRTYQCRFCAEPLRQTFVDLGLSPLCETYIDAAHLKDPELLYPLHSFVCGKCFLVQLPEHVTAKNTL